MVIKILVTSYSPKWFVYTMSGGFGGSICTQSYSKSGGRRNMYLLYFPTEIHERELTGSFYGGKK